MNFPEQLIKDKLRGMAGPLSKDIDNYVLAAARWIWALCYHEQAKRYNRLKEAADPIGGWLSAALDDEKVCEEMKRDIRSWFEVLEKN